MDKTPEELKAEMELNAAIGIMARATSSIDLYLCYLVAEIIHPPPRGQDMDLASIIVLSQGRLEGRFAIARKIIRLHLRNELYQKPHTYERKFAEFVLAAFNKVADQSKEHAWVRNAVAHGTIISGDPPRVVPQVMNVEDTNQLIRKRKAKGQQGVDSTDFGFEANELLDMAEQMRTAASKFVDITAIIRPMFGPQGEALEAAIAQLGRDLQLQAPLRDRPRRKAKPKPAHKPNN